MVEGVNPIDPEELATLKQEKVDAETALGVAEASLEEKTTAHADLEGKLTEATTSVDALTTEKGELEAKVEVSVQSSSEKQKSEGEREKMKAHRHRFCLQGVALSMLAFFVFPMEGYATEPPQLRSVDAADWAVIGGTAGAARQVYT